MLYEIISDKFKEKRVEFHNGLNTVLGTNLGDNSIGKSTFLMIVDFVFGGSTYNKLADIIRNVGHHDIKFSFIFGKKQYWFTRNTLESNLVWKCNDSYNKEKSISLDKYCDWLNQEYGLSLPFLSFRDAVGRYIRVYGKENLNEKFPLHVVKDEKAKKASYALLKLFDLYTPIHELTGQYERSKDELKVYKNAQKYRFISNITKLQSKENEKEINRLTEDINGIAIRLENGLLDLDAELSEEAIRIKQQLSKTRKQNTYLKSKLQSVENNLSYQFSATTQDFEQLHKFFPDANIRSFETIENFHNKISNILKSELSTEKKRLVKQITEVESIISEYTQQLERMIQNPQISKTILSRHADLQRQIRGLQNQNDAHFELVKLREAVSDNNEKLRGIETEQFAILETKVCQEMKLINEYIYFGTYNAPVLSFRENGYVFFTPDDTGTGIAYKGLVVFDLAILSLTKLPVIVHDSVLLKQISDEAIEKILELYQKAGKQVIISLDKQDSYTKKAQIILEETSVLKLSPNGGELFGRSWG
ncbi:MAG: DUF2326 domain-containing protein [Desulfosporosinus sp.]|nr:DUF2326 domain-containing protein [Desulfosporosinus sp.]